MNVRRTICALALPAFPLALLAGTLVSPTDSTKDAVQLTAASAHHAAWAAAAILELLAAALVPPAVAAVVGAVRGRGAGLANAGGLLGVLGTIGMSAIGFRHVFIDGLAGIDTTQALHALDRIDTTFGPVVLPLMFATPLAFIVLAAAAVRAGIAPRWLPVGAFVFLVSDMLPIPGGEIVQQVVGIATFVVFARAVLSEPVERSGRFVATPAEA
jgi:hypothetical protein